MAGKPKPLVASYARMWPREIFDRKVAPTAGGRKTVLAKSLDLLSKPGVYILYRDDVPYYIGKADKLWWRLNHHASVPKSRHYNFWNFFSAFVIEDPRHRKEIEGILISAMPTANSSEPRLPREKLDKQITSMIREIRGQKVNSSLGLSKG